MSAKAESNAVNPNLNGKTKMSPSMKKAIWLVVAIAVYFIIISLPTPAGLKPVGQKAIALMVVAVIAWITEIVPIAISALVLTFMQHIIGTIAMGPAVQNFANPTLLFVLSSFFLAAALTASGLGKRLSMKLTILSKGSPKKVIFYLMAATAVLSTVISDVPAAAAFAPIGLALIDKNNCKLKASNFAKSLMIGIPFAALIGGVATPAGSSLNVLSLSLLKSTSKIDISFVQWASVGIPVVIIAIPLAWKIMTMVYPPEMDHLIGLEDVHKEYQEIGPFSKKEMKFLVIMILLLITWFTESIHKVPLQASATIGAALFFLPGIELLTWDTAKQKVGWDTILLIGAASSLGTTLWTSGAATWIANSALTGIKGSSALMVILFVVVFTILIHLLVPVNPAIVSVMVPTLAAFAVAIGMNPAFLVIPMGFTVSAAFLLPLDPVPLMTYSSGHYTMGDYFKVGVPVCVMWTIVMTLAMMLLAGPLGLF